MLTCFFCFASFFFNFLFSYCRARDEERLAVCTSLQILRAGNANPRLQPAPRVLPVLDVRIHGRSLWSQCRIHRSVSSLAFSVPRDLPLDLLNNSFWIFIMISLWLKVFFHLYSKYAKLHFYGRVWEAGILFITLFFTLLYLLTSMCYESLDFR